MLFKVVIFRVYRLKYDFIVLKWFLFLYGRVSSFYYKCLYDVFVREFRFSRVFRFGGRKILFLVFLFFDLGGLFFK